MVSIDWYRLMLLLLSVVVFSVGQAHAGSQNLTSDGVALSGYDPVSYHDGQPVAGAESLVVSHAGATYRFASVTNKKRFLAAPETFLPAYGGWCAWAMLEGKKVEVDPERYTIISGVTYLFYDGFWGDTLEKWREKAAVEGEDELVRQADRNWQKIQ